MKYLQQILAKFERLSVRERVLSVAAVIGVAYALFYLFLLSPQQTQAKALRQQLAQQQEEIEALTKAMAAAPPEVPGSTLNKYFEAVKEARQWAGKADALISPASETVNLGGLVRSALEATPSLTLLSMRSLPSERIVLPVAPAAPTAPASAAAKASAPAGAASRPAAAPAPDLYRHGIEVAVSGNYLQFIPFLQLLERSQGRLLWANMRLEVSRHPDSTLRLTIYTLSERANAPLG